MMMAVVSLAYAVEGDKEEIEEQREKEDKMQEEVCCTFAIQYIYTLLIAIMTPPQHNSISIDNNVRDQSTNKNAHE